MLSVTPDKVTLVLFFTYGVSLKLWLQKGLFDREKLIYEEHLKNGILKKIYWVTYGKDDKIIAEHLKKEMRLHQDIEILQMPAFFYGNIGKLLYSIFIPAIFRYAFQKADIFKTNQMSGSWSALLAKWTYKKPLVVRTGYTKSKSENNLGRIYKTKIVEQIEQYVYKHCDYAVVTSKNDKDYINQKYKISEQKIKVIPNYIDKSLFKPYKDVEKYNDKMVFIGRLFRIKNLFNLIKAFSKLEFTLDIFGTGELEYELKEFAKEVGAKINFFGTIPNRQLPNILNKYKYYILPSYFEGMPKTLLEAMACGLICFGTNTEGINEVIENGVNGFLIEGFGSEDIYRTITEKMTLFLSDFDHISENARKNILDEYSLDKCLKIEEIVFKSILL